MIDGQLRIGDLSHATGIKVVTIRYFERAGLLPEPARSVSGQRLYGPDTVARLCFIRRARDLGFSQDQIRGLIDLTQRRGMDCTGVDRIAAAHLAEVEARVTSLQALAHELRSILSSCHGGGDVGECRVIEALTGSSHHLQIVR